MKESIISIKNLTKSYGSNEVLKGINLDIHKGDIVGYIGHNGSGKSTTVKIMLGLINDYGGDVSIFGENIKNASVKYKSRIGYVPEVPDIYDNLTAREYIELLAAIYGIEQKVAEDKAIKLMEIFDVVGVFDARIDSYSKGMKQKFMIVCSMIHNPDILFLDEPINGLDANSVLVFKEVLTKLSNMGKTVFYSSHIMDVVEKISNRIVLLNNGVIEADGTFEELKNSSKEESLEDIFTNITGSVGYHDKADNFIDILKEQLDE